MEKILDSNTTSADQRDDLPIDSKPSAQDPSAAEIFPNKMYSVAEFISIVGISRSSAYNGIKHGGIPSIRIGKRVLISGQYIQSLLKFQ